MNEQTWNLENLQCLKLNCELRWSVVESKETNLQVGFVMF